jgi:hypothetical protein
MASSGAVKWFFGTLVVVAAQMVVRPNALAFEASRTEYGAHLRLSSLPVRVLLDAPVPGFSDGGQGALLRAVAHWNAQACSSPLLVVTDDEDDVLIEIIPVLEHWKFGASIAAHTTVDSDPFRGDIRHVIIEIDVQRAWSQDISVTPNAIDLESVFLHELGHALGLDHSRNQDAVMRAGLKPGQSRRALHDDDRAGVCTIAKRAALDSNSMANVARILWQSKWLFAMMLFSVIGVCVVVGAFIHRVSGMQLSNEAT